MGGPKPPRPDYKLMRDTYEGWLSDAEKQYKTSLSSTEAKLAASGITKDSDMWKKTIGEVESDYQKNLDEIYGSQTYKMVQKYITGVTGAAASLGLTFDPETFKTTGQLEKPGEEYDEDYMEKLGDPSQGPGPNSSRFPFGAKPTVPKLKPFRKLKKRLPIIGGRPIPDTWDV